MTKNMRTKLWRTSAIALMLILSVAASGCVAKNGGSGKPSTDGGKKNPIVTIEMEKSDKVAAGEKIKIELYPEVAPNTVKNFISLVQSGFYDGLIFHRVVPGFVIQGGDPQGTGGGGPGYSIKGEFSGNGFKNDLKHERGVISMARSKHMDSAGSQFFIMVKDSPGLDGGYAAFGKVIEGIEVADKIVSAPRNKSEKPLTNQKMKKVTVETFGVKYGEPSKIK
jgi:peptidyl-prolyl cis-trans isomerase B (cyclophilin B)